MTSKRANLTRIMTASMANGLETWPPSIAAKRGVRPNGLDRKELIYDRGGHVYLLSTKGVTIFHGQSVSRQMQKRRVFQPIEKDGAAGGASANEQQNSIRLLIISG